MYFLFYIICGPEKCNEFDVGAAIPTNVNLPSQCFVQNLKNHENMHGYMHSDSFGKQGIVKKYYENCYGFIMPKYCVY